MISLHDIENHCKRKPYYVLVQSIHFPAAKETDLPANAAVSVCFERGGKMVSSEDCNVNSVRKGIVGTGDHN